MAKFVISVLVVVVALSGDSLSLPPIVQVNHNKPLILSRGGHLPLNDLYSVDLSALHPGGVCEINFIRKPQLSCGEVIPSVFPCDYKETIIYQHYGCLLDKEMVTLQLSSVQLNSSTTSSLSDVNIQIFSIGLLVQNHDILSSIRLHQMDIEFPTNKTVDSYKLVFPSNLIGKCYYEILYNFKHFKVPMYGQILPSANTSNIIPCGFSEHLQYVRSAQNHTLVDFILINVYFYSEASDVTMYYAVISLDEDSKSIIVDREVLASRMPKTFTVRQAANTPVTPSNLIDGINPIKYIVEIHPLIGLFRTPQSSTELNGSFTEFSEEDLLSGCVSFNPQYNSPLYPPTKFRLIAIYDVLGCVSIEDEIIVTSESLVHFDQVVQRINTPLKVIKGGVAWINSQTIEFYLPVLGECSRNLKMRLAVAPQHGYITQSNGSQIDITTFFSVQPVSNGKVLCYKHFNDEVGFDQMVWEVNCLKSPVLKVSMTVLVAKVQDFHPVHFETNDSEMLIYMGWSQPLTLSNILVAGGHFNLQADKSVINIHKSNGTLVQVSALVYNSPSWLYPLINLESYASFEGTSFSLSEVQQQRVWYTAPRRYYKDTIEITLTDSHGNKQASSIHVDQLQQNINESIFVSTTNDVFVKSSNITIHGTQPVYLTSHYLLTTFAPFSDENIVYLLANEVHNGTLCFVSHTTCLTSVKQFSQQDINQQKVYFLPSTNFTRDVIILEVTVGNFKFHYPKIVAIEITGRQKVNNGVKTFWVREGKEKRLRPDHFPLFSRSAKFVVTQGTEYGMLSYRYNGLNSDLIEFDREDLASRRVWYTQNSATVASACSDSFKYNVVLKNETVSFNFRVLIRQSRSQLAVTISDRPYSIFENNRFIIRGESFLVQTSFCPEFVTFNIVAPPQFGVLNLIDLEYSVVVPLNTSSKFTLKDINAGLVHYTLLDSKVNTSSDFIILNASDPVSHWPLERRQTPHVGRFELLIDTKTEVKRLNLRIKTPRTVSWLPEYKKYGAVLSQNDIDISNSTIDPSEVNIQVNFDLNYYYQLEIDSNSVSVFTLDDVYSERVIFTKIMFQENEFQDAITFAVNVEVDIRNETFTALGGTHSLAFIWAFVLLSTDHLIVSEEKELINFTIRRIGNDDLWFESRVFFSTHSQSAIGTNCSDLNYATLSEYDFCHVKQWIIFEPNATSVNISVKLLNDVKAESIELFSVRLSNPENAVFGHEDSHFSSAVVSIADSFDYAHIKFEAEIARKRLPCHLELGNVHESENVLAINLTRSRNIYDRVGILCRTEPASAQEGLDYEGKNSIIWFEANQTTSTCNISIINDPLHEVSEYFRVILESVVNGKAQPEHKRSELCVFIRADIDDEPAVSFVEARITVQENQTGDVISYFKIQRTGTDLRNSTVVQYSVDDGSATYDVDYEIYTGNNRNNPYCKRSGQGIGCVVFGEDGSPLQTVAFRIRNDSIFEGTEVFYVNIIPFPHMAHVGYPNRLTVTILDSSKPPIVGFEFPHHFENESSHWTNVSVVRSGSLQDTLVLTCSFNGITATVNSDYLQGDVNVAVAPEEITFHPGQRRAVCPFRINDDHEFEEEELFEVNLKTSDKRIIIPENISSTIVHIFDPEDVPTIQFERLHFSAVEPISNYLIDSDSVLLTIVRSGDVNINVGIKYNIIDGQEDSGSKNQTVYRLETFLRGVSKKQISIPLRAYRSTSSDTFLTVKLSKIESPAIANIGKNRTATIQIKNREVAEPLLPGNPIIVNKGSTLRDFITQESPLHCIVPCSLDYVGEEVGSTQYKIDCSNIDMQQAIIRWEYSLDKINFHPFSLNTTLTKVHSDFLHPFYFQSGMFVTCTCIPVDKNYNQGYPRTSNIAAIARIENRCTGNVTQNKQDVEIILKSYSSFAAHENDLLEISVSLPRIFNSLPIALIQNPKGHNMSTILLDLDRQVCSSVNNFGESFLSSNMSWYSSLDYSSCYWTFSTWLPINHLLQCKPNVNFTTFQMSIEMFVVYFRINLNQTVETTSVQSLKSKLVYSKVNPCLPAPIHYYPEVNGTVMEHLYVYPISVRDMVYFYMVGDKESLVFEPSEPSRNQLLLLYKSTMRTSAWKVWSHKHDPALNIIMRRKESANQTTLLPFKVMLNFPDSSTCIPILKVDAIVRIKNNSSSLHSDFKIGNDLLSVSLKLTQHQKLQLGYTIMPIRISLAIGDNQMEIWKLDTVNANATSNPSSSVHFNTPKCADEIDFEMNTTFIKLETSPMQSLLTVVWALRDENGTQQSIQSTNVTLNFYADFESVTSNVENSQLQTVATVIIFIIFLATTVTIIVIVVTIWMRKVRAGWKKKVQDAMISTTSRQICITTNQNKVRSSVVINNVKTSSVQRTQSVMGFSTTAEYYFRQKHNNVSLQPGSLPRLKCRSMPDLSRLEIYSSIEELMLEPRRNLNTVHTRVKMLNSNPVTPVKNSSVARKRLLKTNTVDNLRTSRRQEITPKLNNCSVAEHKLNTEKDVGKKDSTWFAVQNVSAGSTTIKSQRTQTFH